MLKPKDRRYTIAVDKGLALRVQPSGTKSWVLRIPINGRVIDITLGHFPDLGLQQAKAEARKRQKSFDIDPIKSYTLNDAFALWCASKKGRIVSYERERRTIQRHLIQYLGNYQLDEISAPLVIKTVKVIEASGHQCTLKHVLMRLREILDLAVYAVDGLANASSHNEGYERCATPTSELFPFQLMLDVKTWRGRDAGEGMDRQRYDYHPSTKHEKAPSASSAAIVLNEAFA